MTRNGGPDGTHAPGPAHAPDGTTPRLRFSIAKRALYALGAGVVVLAISVPIIVVAARWSPIAGLVAVLIAVVAVIAAIGTVATRMVNSARDDYLTAQQQRPDTN